MYVSIPVHDVHTSRPVLRHAGPSCEIPRVQPTGRQSVEGRRHQAAHARTHTVQNARQTQGGWGKVMAFILYTREGGLSYYGGFIEGNKSRETKNFKKEGPRNTEK